MKCNDKRSKRWIYTVNDVKVGECFEYGIEVFIKSDYIDDSDVDYLKRVWCINIRTGHLEQFKLSVAVVPTTVHCTIDDFSLEDIGMHVVKE